MSMITKLEPHQVFVFGANASGFHGAGAAGFAFRGTSKGSWRTDPAFLAALKAPQGAPERVGYWAVLGVGQGYQEGKEGASYAITTVAHAGKRRSIPLEEIGWQLEELAAFAEQHPEKEFLVTKVGEGLAGYSGKEMDAVYARIDWPANCVLLGRTKLK